MGFGEAESDEWLPLSVASFGGDSGVSKRRAKCGLRVQLNIHLLLALHVIRVIVVA